ncbi:MAG TPA: ABC transporter ATP-binding protein [Casimicrobiaceae bacterium]|nr:ABC transporter ATP-binding protein [Casimicrobiaceae bacterium]
MLRIDNLRSGYTAIDVLNGVSLSVPDNGIVGVLGANGAGKTALLRAISGLNAVRGGRIEFDGAVLAGALPDAVVRLGVVQVPQGRMLFGSMTVRENLELGAYLQSEREALQSLEIVHQMFPVLLERSRQPAAYLSGGEQQMLALARALMGKPRLLLLDEPSLGLAPKIFDTILDRVRLIHAAGASILIAEQNARKILRLAQHCYVLENGAVAFDGPAAELARDPRIEQTYLGAQHST